MLQKVFNYDFVKYIIYKQSSIHITQFRVSKLFIVYK